MCHIENICSIVNICFRDSAMAIDDSLLNSETDGQKEVMTPFQ